MMRSVFFMSRKAVKQARVGLWHVTCAGWLGMAGLYANEDNSTAAALCVVAAFGMVVAIFLESFCD